MQQSGRGPQFGPGLSQLPILLMAHPAVISHTLKTSGLSWLHLYCHSGYPPCGSLIVVITHERKMGKVTFTVQCPGVYHNPCPVPNPESSSRVCLHHVLLTNTFVSGQGRGACNVCSMHLLPSMLGGVNLASVTRKILGEAGWQFCQKDHVTLTHHSF